MFRATTILAITLACAASTAWGVTVGQLDDFEDGTTMGWAQGGAGPFPKNVTTGGPGGADDHFLQNDASGRPGQGGRQVMFNRDQWTGDFTAAGVIAVTADVINLGDTPMSLRLALDVDQQRGSRDRIVSTAAVEVPAGSRWMSVTFPATPDDFKLLSGTSVANTLANVGYFRIFHNPNVSFPPPPLGSSLGIDNIMAVGLDIDPADFDKDGDVDGDDFLIWQLNFGTREDVTHNDGDADRDGDVDGDDFLAWQLGFGKGSGGGGNAANVPEPTTAAVLVLLVAASLARAARPLS